MSGRSHQRPGHGLCGHCSPAPHKAPGSHVPGPALPVWPCEHMRKSPRLLLGTLQQLWGARSTVQPRHPGRGWGLPGAATHTSTSRGCCAAFIACLQPWVRASYGSAPTLAPHDLPGPRWAAPPHPATHACSLPLHAMHVGSHGAVGAPGKETLREGPGHPELHTDHRNGGPALPRTHASCKQGMGLPPLVHEGAG